MEKRRLGELRVVDLRVELEKRGLDKNGVKAALVERLALALSSEGHDPETYVFDTAEATAPKRTPVSKRQRRTKEGDAEQEGEEDEEEPESGDSVQHDNTSEATHEDNLIDEKPVIPIDRMDPMEGTGDVALFKVPNQESRIPSPDAVEPQYQFTSEDTIRLHANRQLAADDSSSLCVNTDDGGGSEVDQSENDTEGDKASLKTEPIDENDVTVPSIGTELFDPSNLKQEEVDEKDPPAPMDITPADSEDKTTTDDAQRSEDTKTGIAEKAKPDAPTDKPADKVSKGKDLWISGLASNTRAAEIKALFSKYGRVTVAKIVQSTKSPGSKCYGVVAMATPEEASKCIQHLHRTELHGRVITVERAKNDQLTINAKKDTPATTAATIAAATAGTQIKKPAPSNTIGTSVPKSGDAAPGEDGQQAVPADSGEGLKSDADNKEATKASTEGEKKDGKQLQKQSSKEKLSKDTKPKEKHKSRSRSPHRSGDSRDRTRTYRPGFPRPMAPRLSRPTTSHRPILSRPPPPPRPSAPYGRSLYERSLARATMVRDRAAVMRREREQRERERERERARQKEVDERVRQKEMEFRQREEKLKLAKEIERLKYEREKLERERLELEQLRMQTAFARNRMPPPTVPASSGLKRPYDSTATSYTPDAKRGNYGAVSGSTSYGNRSSGRERSPTRRESYGARDGSRSGNRYSTDTSRSSERRPPSSSGRSGSGTHHREDDYRQRRSESGTRAALPRSTSSRRVSSPPRRSRDAPPPPPPPRGAPAWGSGTAGRHTSSSTRDRDNNYGNSNRISSGSSANYGSGGRTFSQQSSSGHGAAPWGAGANLSGMPTVAAWARPGPAAPVGSGVWTNIPSNVFPNPMAGATGAGNYNTSTDRFDTYGKAYSGSTGRRY